MKQKKKSENRNSVAIANEPLQKKNYGVSLEIPDQKTNISLSNQVAQLWPWSAGNKETKKAEISAPTLISTTNNQATTPIVNSNKPEVDTSIVQNNHGLLEMVKNSNSILSDNELWEGQKTHNLSKGITIGGIVGGLTSGAGTGTQKEIDEASGRIVTSVGSGISTLFSSVKSITKLYKAAKNKDPLAAADGGKEFLSALKSGFSCASEVMKYISSAVPSGIAASIPGLGIATSACNIIINAYNGINAKKNENQMTEASDEYRNELEKLMKKKPEENTMIFQMEERGKRFNRKEYLRLKPSVREEIDNIINPKSEISSPTFVSTTNGQATTPIINPIKGFAAFQKKYDIPEEVTLEKFNSAILTYELGSKMQEINQKRKVFSGREIATDILSIAGDIASFFPADGGLTAATLKGTASGLKVAQSLAKLAQGTARNRGWLGADTTRSSAAKHAEYVGHTKSIYMIMANINLTRDTKNEEIGDDSIKKAKFAESMINAAGALPNVAYNTNYDDKTSKIQQVRYIIESMKKGR